MNEELTNDEIIETLDAETEFYDEPKTGSTLKQLAAIATAATLGVISKIAWDKYKKSGKAEERAIKKLEKKGYVVCLAPPEVDDEFCDNDDKE